VIAARGEHAALEHALSYVLAEADVGVEVVLVELVPAEHHRENAQRAHVLEAAEVVDVAAEQHDDHPFIVLTETKFSFRCIPVWIGTLL
jgi:hypothetical protein